MYRKEKVGHRWWWCKKCRSREVLGYLISTVTTPRVSLPLDVSLTLMTVPFPAIMILPCIHGLFLRGLMWARSPCCTGKEGVCWLAERIFLTPQQVRKMHLHLPVKSESRVLQRSLGLGFPPLAIKLLSHRITRAWVSETLCVDVKQFLCWIQILTFPTLPLAAVQLQEHIRKERMSKTSLVQASLTLWQSLC